MDEHCQSIRDKCWDIRAYPCIGMGIFLYPPMLPQHPGFAHVIKTWTPASRFLDIGAFLGIEDRALASALSASGKVADGADPTSQIYPLDVVDFWHLGLEYFRDYDSAFARREHYISADFLGDIGAAPLRDLEHRFSVVHVGHVLHLFGREKMTDAAERLVFFTKPQRGSVIMGNQMGNRSVAREFTLPSVGNSPAETLWQHDVNSFEEMMQEVGKRTGTKWRVHAEWKDVEEVGWPRQVVQLLGEGAGLLFFWCELVELA